MKVILQQDIKGQGKKGELVQVSDGYARNFLLPRNMAVIANAENVNAMKQRQKAQKRQQAAEKAAAEETAEKLERILLKIPARAGENGRLFGAVTAKEISESLTKQEGLDIAKTKILLEEPIKSCGSYQIKCKLGYEITGTLNIMVTEAK